MPWLRLRIRVAAKAAYVLVLLVGVPAVAGAQDGQGIAPQVPFGATPPHATAPGGLRVFLDCAACDYDLLRHEAPYLNYMRERQDAQVHILVTTQATADALEYTLAFIGRAEFAGVDDVVRYTPPGTVTRQEISHGLVRRIQLGVARYLARSPAADAFGIERLQSPGVEQSPQSDPWNLWVYRLRLSGSVSAEESLGSNALFGSFSANRVSERWKTLLGVNISATRTRYDLTPTDRFTSSTRNVDLSGLLVGSLGSHWAWAVGSSATAATFVNQDLTVRVAPGVQYNVFPYDESTRRQLTITYAVGATAFDYEQLTIFGKTSETLTDETVTVALDIRQPWGQSGLAVEASHFFADVQKHHVTAFATTDVRIVRGLSFSVNANASRIRDQVFLPAAGLTPEEILVQRQQLATNYRFAVTVGFTISFGSPYSNIVNSRFAGSSGGIVRTF